MGTCTQNHRSRKHPRWAAMRSTSAGRGSYSAPGTWSGSADIAEPLADSALHAEIDTASFRTRNPLRDRSVRSARFLDAARFPVISFRDGLVSADGRTVRGTLTVRKICRPVSLSIGQVTMAEQSFTASATVRVDRTEFGVTAMPGLAGRYLDLTMEVRCARR